MNHRVLWCALLAVPFLLLLAEPSRAQALPTCNDWAAISKWNVTISYSGSGSYTDPSGDQHLTSENGTITAQVKLDAPPSDQCPAILDSAGNNIGGSRLSYTSANPTQVQYLVNMKNITNTTCTGKDNQRHPYEVDYTMNAASSALGLVNIVLDFSDPSRPPQVEGGFRPSADGQIINFMPDSSCGSHSTQVQNGEAFGPTITPSPNVNFQLAGPLSTTVGSFSGTESYLSGSYYGAASGVNWTINWTIAPVPPNLDLIVTIPDYNTWRPSAGNSEKESGSDPGPLTVQAQLFDKDTGEPATITPDKVTFKFADVSREPGVALNWPLPGASDPDLTFDCLQDPTCKLSSSDTQAEFTPDVNLGPPAFLVLVNPHDWGAWATLNVTALVGATTVNGHLQAAPPAVGDSDPNIRLPQRRPGSFIADSWKAAHQIPLDTPDTDDQEDSPNGNESYKGDGLTLYEEYRGFYVPSCPGCLQMIHREADPAKKDMFVINVDNAARPDISDGIRLFQDSTGLNVCCRTLTVNQITPDRTINFHHANGPHLADQHAVLIVEGLATTNGCTSSTNGMPGPPKVVNRIFIPPMTDFVITVAERRKNGLVVSPAVTLSKATVAHELGHASSIWHHGDEPEDNVYWYTSDGLNIKEIPKGTSAVGVALYLAADSGQLIHVFTEGGRRAAPKELHAKDVGLIKQKVPDIFPQGKFNGTHSGDVLCFMRYDDSVNYVATGDPTRRYYTGELTGTSLTNTTEGTGTNKSPRTPQSRYGSAQLSPKRGDCATQLCVNDSLTPTPRGDPSTIGFCEAEQNAAE